MKLNFALLAVLISSLTAAPAFAQDWDMQPENVVVVATAYAQPAALVPFAESAISNAASSAGYDLSGLSATLTDATGYDPAEPDNVSANQPGTGNQSISTLPECRTHTLSIISGPVNKNGLPPCSLSSFVKDAGDNAFAIYGDEGGAVKKYPLPPLRNFASINSGISGQTAAGLTTGQAQ